MAFQLVPVVMAVAEGAASLITPEVVAAATTAVGGVLTTTIKGHYDNKAAKYDLAKKAVIGLGISYIVKKGCDLFSDTKEFKFSANHGNNGLNFEGKK